MPTKSVLKFVTKPQRPRPSISSKHSRVFSNGRSQPFCAQSCANYKQCSGDVNFKVMSVKPDHSALVACKMILMPFTTSTSAHRRAAVDNVLPVLSIYSTSHAHSLRPLPSIWGLAYRRIYCPRQAECLQTGLPPSQSNLCPCRGLPTPTPWLRGLCPTSLQRPEKKTTLRAQL